MELRQLIKIIVLGAIMLFGYGASAQEVAYVTDILQLGMHRMPDTSDQPFRKLSSGDRMVILERNRFYARVRAEDGVEGWVKVAYLVDEEPARTRMLQLEQERNQLAAELEATKQEFSDFDATLSSLKTQVASAEAARAAEAEELDDLRDENEDLQDSLIQYRTSVPMSWLAVSAVGMGLLGFALAWWWIDQRSRRRHGGFRVY